MRNRFALAALALMALAAPDTRAGAAANRIEGIQHATSGALTTVRVRGSRTPTFTVYKLDRPARVVVDLAPADMSSALRGAGDGGAAGEDGATFGINSWSVQRVSAHESGDGSRRGVRVVIALARPATYSVATEGNDLVVKVTAREPAPAAAAPRVV
ncbi:MAG TPA: AMIN domain-containing protein, partial [Kofleriaceae bacterium]|nr:AMIN domain-containing protein [Kofleriaceae bacterium]